MVETLEQMVKDLAARTHPARYMRSLKVEPYDWQEEVLDPTLRRQLLLCARQSGKSSVIAAKALAKSKHIDNALILIICPAQDQSKEDMKKIEDFMALDKELPELTHDNTFEKEFRNGSRIIALPGSERSVRGYSGPTLIIIDEAARVLDETYRAARPMMTGADTELVLLTSAFGKRGFFFDAWANQKNWRKIFVKPAFDLVSGQLVDAMPEDDFKKLWREKGVSAYYSKRHTREFLKEELEQNPEWWILQEYMCEFLDSEGAAFNTELLLAARRDFDTLYTGEESKAGDYEPLEV